MAFKDRVKSGLKKNFDIKAWIGLNSIKRSGSTIRDLYRDVFQTTRRKKDGETAAPALSFEESMAKYGLTEADIQKKMSFSLLILRVYMLLFAVMLAYMIYLFVVGQLTAGFFVLVLLLLLLSYIFKEHFNYFQMKQRRLGCSFKEWFNALVRGGA